VLKQFEMVLQRPPRIRRSQRHLESLRVSLRSKLDVSDGGQDSGS
jgi:hypothetical protein